MMLLFATILIVMLSTSSRIVVVPVSNARLLADAGEIVAFRGPKLCSSDLRTVGYEELETLRNDIRARESAVDAAAASNTNNAVEQTYILCPNTTLYVKDNNDPIWIQPDISSTSSDNGFSHTTTLQCGSLATSTQGCTVEGLSTSSHSLLKIGGQYHRVVIQDVAFVHKLLDATVDERELAVVVINSDHTTVEFLDTRWTNNSTEVDTEVAPEKIIWITGSDSVVTLDGVLFEETIVSESLVVVDKENTNNTLLEITNSEFLDNTVGGHLVDVQTSSTITNSTAVTLILSNVTMEGTSFQDPRDGTSLIRLSTDAKVEEGDPMTNSSCAETIVDEEGNCLAILQQQQDSGDAVCTSFQTCPSPENNGDDDDDDICFQGWSTLVTAVGQSTGSKTFRLCAGSVLFVNRPLIVSQSSTTIQCGDSAAAEDNCLILGGTIQVQVIGNPTNVRLQGITFVGSRVASVVARGEAAASLSLEDCVWEDHLGVAAILTQPPTDGISGTITDLSPFITGGDDDLAAVQAQLSTLPAATNIDAMSIDISRSTLRDNRVSLAPITSLGGTILLFETLFTLNTGDVGTVLVSLPSGELAMFNSCLFENTGNLGTVYVDYEASLLQNTGVYGELNSNSIVECVEILSVDAIPSSGAGGIGCASDPSLCTFTCESFFGGTGVCPLFDPPSASPTSNPSNLPTLLPTPVSRAGQPSPSPSMVASDRPSISPSTIPSTDPSALPSNVLSSSPTSFPSHLPSFFPTQVPEIGQRTTTCSQNPDAVGYENQSFLFGDIEQRLWETFQVCPGVLFSTTLTIDNSQSSQTITLECISGPSPCIWIGLRHVQVEVGASMQTSLRIQGFTFRDALDTSISAEVDPAGSLALLMQDCIWTSNSGQAVLLVDELADLFFFRGLRGERESQQQKRSLQLFQSLLEVQRCSFIENDSSVVISNSVANLRLIDSVFEGNDVGKSVVENNVGTTALDGTELRENLFSRTRGLVFVGRDASYLTPVGGSCEGENEGRDGVGASCDYVLLAPQVTCAVGDVRPICTGTCIPFPPCPNGTDIPSQAPTELQLPSNTSEIPSFSPTAENSTFAPTVSPTSYPSTTPSVEPSFEPLECYPSLRRLSQILSELPTYTDSPFIIELCAGTLFDEVEESQYSPVVIPSGLNVKIQCGKSGLLSQSCLFFGGRNSFRITGVGTIVEFAGISFIAQERVSVVAEGDLNSKAAFENCRWSQHFAIAAVLIYNTAAGETYWNQRNIERLEPPTSPSMFASFADCVFESNNFSFATVVSLNGAISFTGSVFVNNERSRTGAVCAIFGSSVGIEQTCFIENAALIDGTTFLDSTSILSTNTQNFGQDMEITFGSCEGIFKETEGNCVADRVCNGDCVGFSAESCPRQDLIRNYGVVTAPPRTAVSPTLPPFAPVMPPSPSPVAPPTDDPEDDDDIGDEDPTSTEAPTAASSEVNKDGDPTIPPLPEDKSGDEASDAPPAEVPPPPEGTVFAQFETSEANRVTSLAFVKSILSILLILWCCIGSFRCCRRRALARLKEANIEITAANHNDEITALKDKAKSKLTATQEKNEKMDKNKENVGGGGGGWFSWGGNQKRRSGEKE